MPARIKSGTQKQLNRTFPTTEPAADLDICLQVESMPEALQTDWFSAQGENSTRVRRRRRLVGIQSIDICDLLGDGEKQAGTLDYAVSHRSTATRKTVPAINCLNLWKRFASFCKQLTDTWGRGRQPLSTLNSHPNTPWPANRKRKVEHRLPRLQESGAITHYTASQRRAGEKLKLKKLPRLPHSTR